jgi:hypothetical protein
MLWLKCHTPPERQKTLSELDRTPGKALLLSRIPRQENKTHNQNQSAICRIKSWQRGCNSIPAFEEETMNEANRVKYLRVALMAVGVIFIVGIYSLIMIWPSGWSWHSGPSHSLPHYLQMILGVYATLGVFLLLASRNPLANLSLIWFTVWSSVVHAGIMAAQALGNPEHMGHLWGDVPALLVVAAVLALLTPRTAAAESAVRGLGKTATATAVR